MGYGAYIPTQVPLDATNAVPVRKDFIQRLDPTKQVSRTAQQIWAQSKFQKSALEMLDVYGMKAMNHAEIYMIGL